MVQRIAAMPRPKKQPALSHAGTLSSCAQARPASERPKEEGQDIRRRGGQDGTLTVAHVRYEHYTVGSSAQRHARG